MPKTRTALITGAAVRIGRAIAEALARDGFNIVIHCRSSIAEARTLKTAIEKLGVEAWVVRGNLDGERVVAQLWYGAAKSAGQIDVLVNSAAVFNQDAIGTISGDGLLAEFWPNLFAPMLLTKYFASQSIDGGSVINILDRRIAAHDTAAVPYHLTKCALAEFTRTAAIALAPKIRVNGVAPGPVLPPPGKPASHLRERAGRIPLAKTVAPQDVASAVLALLKMPSCTGQILFVDGGQHLLGNGV